MNKNNEPLRVFVAMPGTDRGASARWKDPSEALHWMYILHNFIENSA